MTSYATVNESSSSSPPGATTSTGETQQQQQHNQQQDTIIVSPTSYTTDSNVNTSTAKLATANSAMQQSQHQHQQQQQQQQYNRHHSTSQFQHQDLSDCDCDSLSDGREKADTTPENIKKIDDIIELELELERTKRQQRSSSSSAMNDASTTVHISGSGADTYVHSLTGSTSSIGNSGVNGSIAFGVGLSAAVVDESNAKFCFVKKPALCTEKEARLMDSGSAQLMPAPKALDSHQLSGSSNQSPADITTATTPTVPTAAFDESSYASNTAATAKEEIETDNDNNSKRSCAFTLSFDNNDSNAAATAARYKSVMERFQSRHRRGASMSKLDNDGSGGGGCGDATMTSSLTGDGLSLSSSASVSPLTLRSAGKFQQKMSHNADVVCEESVVPKVKLRPRDRSTSRVRDAAKRHSWSPRSSTSELSAAPPLSTHTRYVDSAQSQQQQQSQPQQRPPNSARRNTTGIKSKPPPPPPPLVLPKGGANLVANRTQQFTPRSKAMQLAFQKIEFLCPQAPLADYEHADGEGDDVSEAGTYTLDGDNYTEEQKDLMNIDKSARSGRRQHKHEHHVKHHGPISPNSPQKIHDHECTSGLPNTITTKIPVRTSNVLEVNYFHNDTEDAGHEDHYTSPRLKSSNAADDFLLGNHQSAGDYLEKIKSRVLRNLSGNVKNISSAVANVASEAVHSPPNDDEDIGCFTSVTTSGVLAKQGALAPRPKLSRKSSLTTSQIDSSEYVSNEVKLKSAPSASTGGSYTDIQKAEYRLNLFTNQKDLHKYAATRNLIETPPETPIATTDKIPSDTAALTMAQSKNDWIQQWARNARARSLASDSGKLQQQHQQQKVNAMTRSYNCGPSGGSLTDDSLYSQQLNARYRMPGASDNEFDYSSDPSLLTSVAYAKSHEQDGSGDASVKPPKSPSKIPSPLHSIGRTRSASRTRGSLQGLMAAQEDDDDGEDIYLQKTAAAINTLQQSISRKNSLKSPTGSISSPRMNAARNQLALQNNEDGESPQRSIESDSYQTQRHRRNLSNESYAAAASAAQAQAQLMTSSFNEQQLQLLTSGEYLIKQMRMRKNSFDGNICSPRRRIERAPENTTLSPLHRGGSFSMKIANANAAVRSARPQYQNIYTPPAARQGYVPLSSSHHHHHQQRQQQQHSPSQQMAQIIMKKSASSNNFGQAYSDYDDNLEYYINDADDDLGLDLNIEDEEELEYGEYEYGDANEEYGPRTITLQAATIDDTPALAPLTTTRYNKALLMRIERSKQRAAAAGGGGGGTNNKPTSAPAGTKNFLNNVPGLVACPNTPELPRRNVKSAPRASVGTARQSVPRDTSLSRLASQVPNSLASAKKQLLQTAAAGVPLNTRSSSAGQRVQPKYMDISKYKPAQGNAFLRKNESKSTLKAPISGAPLDSGIRRSPSSSGLSRVDPTRASNRSIRSAMTSSCTGAIGGGSGSASGGGGLSGNVSRASSAVRRDDSVTKQKEIEMAMWKRRSTYDPLKAAAEDRRRKEEAKRLAMAKTANEVLCESTTSEDQ